MLDLFGLGLCETWRKLFLTLLRFVLLGKSRRQRWLVMKEWEDATSLILFSFIYPLCRLFRSLRLIRLFQYEKEVVSLLITMSGDLFVDVGANYGFYSLLLSPYFTRIIVIEPSPKIFQKLHRTVESLIPNGKFVEKAITNYEGVGNFCIANEVKSSHFLLDTKSDLWHRSGWIPQRTVQIPTTTLFQLLQKESKIDLIKVDVEGAEWEVVDGAMQIMEKIGAWLIEVHEPKERSKWEQKMGGLGYSTYWFEKVDRGHIFAYHSI